MKNKFIAILVTVCMAFSLIPAMEISAVDTTIDKAYFKAALSDAVNNYGVTKVTVSGSIPSPMQTAYYLNSDKCVLGCVSGDTFHIVLYNTSGKIYLPEDSSNLFFDESGISGGENVDENGIATDASYNGWPLMLTDVDLTGLDASRVTNMSDMFTWSGVQNLNLSGWDTSKVTDMSYMLHVCKRLQSLDITGWDTSNVYSMDFLFNNCSSIQNIEGLSELNVGKITHMNKLFYGCAELKNLDLSNWDTSNVTDMYRMFNGCSGLVNLSLNDWNVGNVTDMRYMFYNCSSLTSLNLSSWSGGIKITDSMFEGYSGLTSLNLSGWDVKNIQSAFLMFSGCSSLTSLNLNGWNLSNVG